jgi:hypothetical protein
LRDLPGEGKLRITGAVALLGRKFEEKITTDEASVGGPHLPQLLMWGREEAYSVGYTGGDLGAHYALLAHPKKLPQVSQQRANLGHPAESLMVDRKSKKEYRTQRWEIAT